MQNIIDKIDEIKEMLNEDYGIKFEDISIDISIDAVSEGVAERIIRDVNYTTERFNTGIILKEESFEASHRLIENISDKVIIRLMGAQYTIK